MEKPAVSLFDLTGKNAFVTGASRGIGKSIAIGLADAGADVALVAGSEDGLAETAASVSAVGRKAFVIPANVTSSHVAGSHGPPGAGRRGADATVGQPARDGRSRHLPGQ